jgi:hypothetical protein
MLKLTKKNITWRGDSYSFIVQFGSKYNLRYLPGERDEVYFWQEKPNKYTKVTIFETVGQRKNPPSL